MAGLDPAGALWAANNGGALLKTLRDKEQGAKP
jgi:hypothetical protein